MLKRLYELRDYARHNIDTVVSVGIGGSFTWVVRLFSMSNVVRFGIISVRKNEMDIHGCILQALM